MDHDNDANLLRLRVAITCWWCIAAIVGVGLFAGGWLAAERAVAR